MTAGETTRDQPAAAAERSDRAVGSTRLARWVLEIAVAVVLVALVRAFLVQSFYVPSASMEPTVRPGDRVLVDRLHGSTGLRRGDLVVFDGTTAWPVGDSSNQPKQGAIGRVLDPVASALGIRSGERDYLKRIVGMPGDHVVCCTEAGRLTVNGTEVPEPYLPPGAAASDVTFDVTVPSGRLWLLGDNRPVSADARAHLGDAGGGMVPVDEVVGRVTLRYWPLSRWGTIDRSSPLSSLRSGGGP